MGSIDKGPNKHKIELEVSVSVRDEKQAGEHKLRCDRSTVTCTCTTFLPYDLPSPLLLPKNLHTNPNTLLLFFLHTMPLFVLGEGLDKLEDTRCTGDEKAKSLGHWGTRSSNVLQKKQKKKKKTSHAFSISTPLSTIRSP